MLGWMFLVRISVINLPFLSTTHKRESYMRSIHATYDSKAFVCYRLATLFDSDFLHYY